MFSSCIPLTSLFKAFISEIDKIFLGVPAGFNSLGAQPNMQLNIFATLEDTVFNKLNIPVWKFKDDNGYVIVKGMCPRINENFLYIFLEDCFDQINCLEITQQDIEGM